MDEELDAEELGGGFPTAAIVGVAVAAGLVAFLISRARRASEAPPPPPQDIRERTVVATRDFVAGRLLPELKPVLLDLLKDAKTCTDLGFKRVEQAIRSL